MTFKQWIFTFSETTNLFVFFYFIHYPYFIWTATPFWPFLWVELSQFSLFECHTCASPFSLCECYKCHTNIFASPLLLSGHSFCFLLGNNWPILILTLCGLHVLFLKWKIHLPTSFLSFGITNLFITTFTISNVIIYFYFLVFFFLFWRFI